MAMLQFDYDSILTDLTSRLQNKLQATTIGGSAAQALLEIIAEKLSQVVRYSEYLTRETKWSLAQNASSILSQMELFGYKPHRKIGSKGTIRVSTAEGFNANYPYRISIPKFSKFSNGALTFCTMESAELTPSIQYVDIPIVQGNPLIEEFKTADINNYRYIINNNSIENSVYQLVRDSSIVTEVENFGDTLIQYNGEFLNPSPSSEYGYQYEYKVRNINGFEGIELQFPSGDYYSDASIFSFTYLITEGASGNVVTEGAITTVLDSFIDSNGTPVQLYCTNITPVNGGSGYETIDEMRQNAPLSFNRVDKIITRNDYISAIRSLIGDSVFYIWTEEEANEQITQFFESYDFINNSRVFVCGIAFDTETRVATPIEEATILNINTALEQTKGLTDYFVIQQPTIFKFYLSGEIFFDGTLINLQAVQEQVFSLLTETYGVNNLAFFESLYHSDYISIFRDIPEIDHVDVVINPYLDLELSIEGVKGAEVISTKGFEHFSFSKTVDSKFYITLYNKNTRNLIKDIAYTSYDSNGTYTWYVRNKNNDGWTKVTASGENNFGWNSTNIQMTPTNGMFGPLEIIGSYKDYLKDEDGNLYSDEEYSLVVRLVPFNDDAVLLFQQDILTLTDSSASVLNVWEDQLEHANTNDSLVFTEIE